MLLCLAGLLKHAMQSYPSYQDARASLFLYATQQLEQ
jgi:hypothetical protein